MATLDTRGIRSRMDHAALLSLCERGVQAARSAGADEAEVYAESSAEVEVSLQKNDLDQVRVSDEVQFGVRVFLGGRLGFATANDPGAVVETARDAVAVARASPPDPDAGLPAPRPVAHHPDAVDEALVALDPGVLAEMAVDLLQWTRGRDPRITIDTGGVSVAHTVRAVASSAGVRASWASAAGSGHMFGMAVDGGAVGSFAYDGDAVRRLEDLRPRLETAFGRFVEGATGALGATAGESFRGPIVLPPEAVESVLIGPLMRNLGGDAVRQGRSALADKIGERIAAPGFTLLEGGAGLEGYPQCPFDREGQPRTALLLVEDGILKAFLYDGREARAAGVESTGHAQGGATALPRVGPAALALGTGDVSRAALENMDRGVIVTRFSGTTDPVSGDFSGVVKGGFLVRDGERRPIHETTIAGNLWTCLRNVSARADSALLHYGSRAWPALRVEDVSITAG
ncbi:MAG: TldD/PmbA family protein [Myxococcota bacterium]|nr:TldD/PmbA family protein [Myxococcota bacterium]